MIFTGGNMISLECGFEKLVVVVLVRLFRTYNISTVIIGFIWFISEVL